MKNLVLKIRKKNAETDEVIITIGSHLATEQVFKSEKEALDNPVEILMGGDERKALEL